jgi:predicted nucleic acid-binding protein
VITAVDTNVLIDVLGANAAFGPASGRALRRCLVEGVLIACDTVWAETTAYFADREDATAALAALRVEFSPLDAPAASNAGESWRAYRRAGGTRERMIADFLIGAHATKHADRLLTRDRGFYRAYFAELAIVDPAPVPPAQRPAP